MFNMKENDNTTKKKYQLIKPFFEKKKKLKEISKESGISYATLKRWVKQYKEGGIKGLEKKERKVQNSFKLNNELIEKIKKLYLKFHHSSITKLYKLSNIDISYSTFYRIIDNLDENIKQQSKKSFPKETLKEFGITNIPIFLAFFNKNIIYNLIIYYNLQTFDIINFSLEINFPTTDKILHFIGASILKNGVFPRDIYIDTTLKNFPRKLKHSIELETKINIFYKEQPEIKKFLRYIEIDILKEYSITQPKTMNELNIFLENYFFIKNNINNNIDISKLNKFFKVYKRKVHHYGILFKNVYYNDDSILKYKDNIVDIYTNIFISKYIYIFYEKNLLKILTLNKNNML